MRTFLTSPQPYLFNPYFLSRSSVIIVDRYDRSIGTDPHYNKCTYVFSWALFLLLQRLIKPVVITSFRIISATTVVQCGKRQIIPARTIMTSCVPRNGPDQAISAAKLLRFWVKISHSLSTWGCYLRKRNLLHGTYCQIYLHGEFHWTQMKRLFMETR